VKRRWRYTATLSTGRSQARQQYGDHVRARWLFPVSPPVLGLGMVRHGVLAISTSPLAKKR
jgi:hypothetical protein